LGGVVRIAVRFWICRFGRLGLPELAGI
jgi:hypothetical protein